MSLESSRNDCALTVDLSFSVDARAVQISTYRLNETTRGRKIDEEMIRELLKRYGKTNRRCGSKSLGDTDLARFNSLAIKRGY